MDPPARMVLGTRCRAQVLLCSRCDRGNRYCGRACRRLAHDAARRETARRYPRSRGARLVDGLLIAATRARGAHAWLTPPGHGAGASAVPSWAGTMTVAAQTPMAMPHRT